MITKNLRLWIFIVLISFKLSLNLIAQSSKIDNNENLIQIDYKDEKYNEFRSSISNKQTEEGWKIRYLVKNDTTKYHDVYIECSKGNTKGIYKGEKLFDYRSYFIPTFEGENSDYLFFTHGCSSTCSAILVFSKKTADYQDYSYLVAFDMKKSAIIYVPEQEDYNPLKLIFVNLKKRKDKMINFKNRCMSVMGFKSSCIDEVIFSKHTVEIKTNLIDIKDEERLKEIEEIQKVKY
jgi:hypothetical protein